MKDNLNTHKPASLYEAFPAAEAAGWSGGSSGTNMPQHRLLPLMQPFAQKLASSGTREVSIGGEMRGLEQLWGKHQL